MDGTGSGSCNIAGFSTSGVSPLVSSDTESVIIIVSIFFSEP
jgi:hypothetical protein